ncbi:hypothetical protein GCM10009654_58030 [Streptomyces hebeiensis]|uniref:Uncharacterized protein n=1 Tax=Streptomyces hebeiensis TaxID=229486 RepID=A0ABN1V605_9ACTN
MSAEEPVPAAPTAPPAPAAAKAAAVTASPAAVARRCLSTAPRRRSREPRERRGSNAGTPRGSGTGEPVVGAGTRVRGRREGEGTWGNEWDMATTACREELSRSLLTIHHRP